MSLLGIDIGTTGCKALAFDLDGNIQGKAYKGYSLIYPNQDWIELDPLEVWNAVKIVVNKVANLIKKDKIEALSFSVIGEAVIPVSRKGRILYNAITSPDNRALVQSKKIEKTVGLEKIYKITGQPNHPCYTLSKILWFRDVRPDIFFKTWKFLLFEDFLIFKMGLKPVIDYSLASRTLAFNIHSKEWSSEILNKFNINREILADIGPPGQVVGELPVKTLKELGLSNKVLVVLGGHDQAVAAFGAGIVKDYLAVDSHGTTESIVVSFKEIPDYKKLIKNNFSHYCHVKSDLFICLAYNYTGGNLLQWYINNFGAEEKKIAKKSNTSVTELIIEKSSNKPTNLFILPYFTGSGTPYLNPFARGVILGLTFEDKKSDIIKAILESNCYELRLNLELLEDSGIRIDKIFAVGGASKSSKWLQLKADICGKKFYKLNISETGCLGAAILAGFGLGVFTSIEQVIQKFIFIKEVFEPNIINYKEYSCRYNIYKEIYPKLSSTFLKIASL